MRAYKVELAPNNKQRGWFNRCAGTSRFVYNWALADRQQRYVKGEKTNLYEQRRRFNALKDEQCPWVREVPYAVTESAFRNCDFAFQNFFRRVKNGEKPGYPKFKQRGRHDSFQLRNTRVAQDAVMLTHLGEVRLKERSYIPLAPNEYGTYAAISREADRWFISVLVRDGDESPDVAIGDTIGIDLGINALATCSNGKTFDNRRCLDKAQTKLNRCARELSRRKQGGHNWHKTKRRLQQLHYRVACARKHALHEISHYVTEEAGAGIVVIEDLNVRGMQQNHHLARAISDVGFYELRRQIEYKAASNGIEVIVADMWEPSSKRCSGCGNVKTELRLSERTYRCEVCGLEMDRDLNAARNLAALAH
jgi:putative transposase